jgi:hypothetical protein
VIVKAGDNPGELPDVEHNARRGLYEIEDFGPSEAMERFREMGIGTEKR